MMEPLNTINDVQTFLFRATQIATNHGCLIGDVQLDGSVAHGAAMDYDESSHSSSEDCHKGLKIRLLNHLSATMCQTRGDNSPCVALLKETLTGGVVTVWVTSATAVPPHLKDQVCAFLSSIGSYMEIIGQGRRDPAYRQAYTDLYKTIADPYRSTIRGHCEAIYETFNTHLEIFNDLVGSFIGTADRMLNGMDAHYGGLLIRFYGQVKEVEVLHQELNHLKKNSLAYTKVDKAYEKALLGLLKLACHLKSKPAGNRRMERLLGKASFYEPLACGITALAAPRQAVDVMVRFSQKIVGFRKLVIVNGLPGGTTSSPPPRTIKETYRPQPQPTPATTIRVAPPTQKSPVLSEDVLPPQVVKVTYRLRGQATAPKISEQVKPTTSSITVSAGLHPHRTDAYRQRPQICSPPNNADQTIGKEWAQEWLKKSYVALPAISKWNAKKAAAPAPPNKAAHEPSTKANISGQAMIPKLVQPLSQPSSIVEKFEAFVAPARQYLAPAERSLGFRELQPVSKRDSLLLVAVLLENQIPDTQWDAYYSFGFVVCRDKAERDVLRTIYTGLLCSAGEKTVSFEKLWQSLNENTLVKFLEGYHFGLLRRKNPNLETFLSAPAYARMSVWRLVQFVQIGDEPNVEPFPSIRRDYGFWYTQCKNREDVQLLKSIYAKILQKEPPIDLHKACIKGKLYEFGIKSGVNIDAKHTRLMNNYNLGARSGYEDNLTDYEGQYFNKRPKITTLFTTC